MEWVFASIALVISMLALWLASTALGKTEDQISAFGNVVRKDVGQFKSDISGEINTINQKQASLDKRLDQSTAAEADSRKVIKDLRTQIDQLHAAVDELESSIPPQFRRRIQPSSDRVNN